MSGPNWKLEDDLATVTVSFPSDPPVALKLGTSDTEEMVKNLGEFRALMKPAVDANWSIGQKVAGVVPDPRWYCEPELLSAHSLLHLRDPRFGWLHYMIPSEEARKLGQVLIAQADVAGAAIKSSSKN